VDAIVVDDIAVVPVEQHEYLPMHRGQRARLASNHHEMSAAINVTGPVEIVRDGDLLAASLTQRHSSSAAPRPGVNFMANVPVTV
jgi:hypothetical protein